MASDFLTVKCKCGNEMNIFSKTTSNIECSSCNEVLVHSTGGKAAIHAKVVKKLD